MKSKLDLDFRKVERARKLAVSIADGVQNFVAGRTTVSVERAVCRLMGIDGVDSYGVPLPNVVVEHLASRNLLQEGASYCIANAMMKTGLSPQRIAEEISAGRLDLLSMSYGGEEEVYGFLDPLAQRAVEKVRDRRSEREALIDRLAEGPRPYLYVIVATGNIYEDVVQARAAVSQGADIVAVIRSTGQSLLDYVPYGPTTEGFGGTYATQENFRIMRAALDEMGEKVGKYIRLCNYCSGLCMPEIAAMGAMERLDVMLNDALYGILFRDINMQRTLIDQFFSRVINGFAG